MFRSHRSREITVVTLAALILYVLMALSSGEWLLVALAFVIAAVAVWSIRSAVLWIDRGEE